MSDSENNKADTEVEDNKAEGEVEGEVEGEIDVVARLALEKAVKKWVTLDDKIREIEYNLREMKKTRQQYEEEILKIDDDTCINITGGKLMKAVTVRKAPIQEKQIKEVISKTEQDPVKVRKLLDDVEVAREVKEKKSIKRLFDKAPKQ